MIAEFFGEEARHDHLGEAEEVDLLLDAAATEHAAADQLVGKVHLAATTEKCRFTRRYNTTIRGRMQKIFRRVH